MKAEIVFASYMTIKEVENIMDEINKCLTNDCQMRWKR